MNAHSSCSGEVVTVTIQHQSHRSIFPGSLVQAMPSGFPPTPTTREGGSPPRADRLPLELPGMAGGPPRLGDTGWGSCDNMATFSLTNVDSVDPPGGVRRALTESIFDTVSQPRPTRGRRTLDGIHKIPQARFSLEAAIQAGAPKRFSPTIHLQ